MKKMKIRKLNLRILPNVIAAKKDKVCGLYEDSEGYQMLHGLLL